MDFLMYSRLRPSLRQHAFGPAMHLLRKRKPTSKNMKLGYRGSFLRQIKNDVLAHLPGDDRLTEAPLSKCCVSFFPHMSLPNFVVIGAGKSGTTSLHYYLKQHPEIYLTTIKELNFFCC